jgi:hypothetical protein
LSVRSAVLSWDFDRFGFDVDDNFSLLGASE